MRWRALLAAAALAPITAHAQPAAAPAEVCVLFPGSAAALEQRAAEVGLGIADQRITIGRDAVVTLHAAEFDASRLARDAAACVARNVRVMAPISSPAVLAARTATRTIPIVAQDLATDPVAAGFVESLSRPGGNLTGVFFAFPDFAAKWLELINETVPGLARVGLLTDPTASAMQPAAIRSVAAARGQMLVEQTMTDLAALDGRFGAFEQAGVQGVLLMTSVLIGVNPKAVAEVALAHRLPTVTMFAEYAQAGGLMAYGPDLMATFRPMGELVGRVLHGANPAELPIDRPSRMRLTVNVATARTLGLSLPASLLARADEVIE